MNQKPLILEEIKAIEEIIDKVIIFDIETFEEIEVDVVRHRLDFNDLTTINLIQDLAWNEKEKRIVISSIGFAPLGKKTQMDFYKHAKIYQQLFYYWQVK